MTRSDERPEELTDAKRRLRARAAIALYAAAISGVTIALVIDGCL